MGAGTSPWVGGMNTKRRTTYQQVLDNSYVKEKRYAALDGTRFALICGGQKGFIERVRLLPGFIRVSKPRRTIEIVGQGTTITLVSPIDPNKAWLGINLTGALCMRNLGKCGVLERTLTTRSGRYGLTEPGSFDEAKRRTQAIQMYLTLHGFDVRSLLNGE